MSKEKTTKDLRKKASFVRTDSHKKKKLGDKWRKPRGIQNKRRLRKRGYGIVVKKGYQTRKETRGKTKSGLTPIIITSLAALENIDKNSQSIIVSSKIGNKKKLEILEQANKLGLNVENLNVENKIKEIKDKLEAKKAEKEKQQKKKAEKEKEEKKKPVEEKVKEEEKKEETEEDVKEKEKKNFDKLLTKKQ